MLSYLGYRFETSNLFFFEIACTGRGIIQGSHTRQHLWRHAATDVEIVTVCY